MDVKARAPHKLLKEHGVDVIQKLPKMIPGEKNGEIVTTGYVLPINFNVD
ncbi:hypothetical protein PG913_10855 [Tenacibaculum pacificus]|nr:hypothetical protein [Tenacibaculum pacificus]WBX74846.1 hypothetical protein PG913_10855 [Tenacibaculum pacificus]